MAYPHSFDRKSNSSFPLDGISDAKDQIEEIGRLVEIGLIKKDTGKNQIGRWFEEIAWYEDKLKKKAGIYPLIKKLWPHLIPRTRREAVLVGAYGATAATAATVLIRDQDGAGIKEKSKRVGRNFNIAAKEFINSAKLKELAAEVFKQSSDNTRLQSGATGALAGTLAGVGSALPLIFGRLGRRLPRGLLNKMLAVRAGHGAGIGGVAGMAVGRPKQEKDHVYRYYHYKNQGAASKDKIAENDHTNKSRNYAKPAAIAGGVAGVYGINYILKNLSNRKNLVYLLAGLAGATVGANLGSAFNKTAEMDGFKAAISAGLA